MYTGYRQLNQMQVKEIAALYDACQALDGGTPIFYRERLLKSRAPKSTWIYTEDGVCYATGSVFYFYDEACEISVLVHPEKRQQGIASQLLRRFYPQLVQRRMKNIIFSLGADTPQKRWISHKGLVYNTSEYHMRREGFDLGLSGSDRRVEIRTAKHSDLSALCLLDNQCFVYRTEMLDRYSSLFKDNNYKILVAVFKGVIIGKAHIQWHNGDAILSDIAVLPLYQRRGFGGELLAGTIETALKAGASAQSLRVETLNTHALELYQRFGFEVVEAFDYYDLSILALERYLEKT